MSFSSVELLITSHKFLYEMFYSYHITSTWNLQLGIVDDQIGFSYVFFFQVHSTSKRLLYQLDHLVQLTNQSRNDTNAEKQVDTDKQTTPLPCNEQVVIESNRLFEVLAG